VSAVQRGVVVFLVGLALVVGAVVVDRWWREGGTTEGGLGAVSIGGPFALTDQNGALRHDTDFRGELMLVYFGYTYCPDACPAALTTMTAALDKLGDAARPVQPIFVTVDPERDTTDQMKLYASNFHPRLLALTGTPTEVAAAASAYRVYFAKVRPSASPDYLVDHSSLVFLMGRDGRYLTYFGPDVTADAMAAAIGKYL
jgi:cytochrome oxidase Cu insertion factor (SCO1/SenC/PrrC family)